MMSLLLFVICAAASAVGSICGIGGGVLIKPLVDAMNILSVPTTSFLSSCTVLAMSGYNAVRTLMEREKSKRIRADLSVAAGAAAGGVLGKRLFQLVSEGVGGTVAGVLQSACLFVLTAGTLLYLLYADRIKKHVLANVLLVAFCGFALGVVSAFLGIGGGPFNIVLLSYLFSMEPREAAKTSLLIVFVSQLASLAVALITCTVPTFEPATLLLMCAGGVFGGVAGREAAGHIPAGSIRGLLCLLNGVILFICAYNIYIRMA